MKTKIAIPMILLIIILAAVLGYTLWQQEVFYEKVKGGVVGLLEEKFGVRIVVGRVEGRLLSDIQLRDVRIKNPNRPQEEITISRVRLRYNLWKILTKKESIFGIRNIELIQPTLQLLRDREGRWNWSEFTDKLFEKEEGTYIPQIVIKEGRLGILDELEGNRLHFNRVNGSISENLTTLRLRDGEIGWTKIDEPLRGVSLLVSLDGERLFIENLILGYRQIEFSLRGEIPDLKERKINLEVVTNIFNLKELRDFFEEERIKNYLGKLDIGGQLKFKGEIYYPAEGKFSLIGEMVLTSQSLPPLFAKLSYQDMILTLSSLLVEDSKIAGDINFKDASVNLKLTALRLDPKIISAFAGQGITWPFLLDGELKIDGPIKNPLLKGEVELISNDPKVKIKNFKVAFSKKADDLQIDSLRLTLLKGTKLYLKGSSKKGYREFYNLNMRGSLYLPIANHYVSSGVRFKGRVRKILSDPYLTGELRLTGLSIDKEKIGNFIHQIRYHQAALNVLTPSPDSSVHASGKIYFSPLRLDLAVRPDNLNLKPLLALYGLKEMEGGVSGNITIKGEVARGLQVDGKALKIKELNLLGGSSGLVSFTAKGETIDILGLELRQVDGGVLSLFGRLWVGKKPSLNLTANCKTIQMGKSLITGRLKAKGELDKFKINGDLKAVTEEIPFDIKRIKGELGLFEGKMLVHSLLARVGQRGDLSIHGSYPLSGQGEGLEFRLKRFDWQEMPWGRDYFRDWQGQMDMSGRFWAAPSGPSLSARLGPLPVKIKKKEFKEFNGELDYQSGTAKIRINPTPHFLIEGEIIPSASRLNLKTEITRERLSVLERFLPLSFGRFDGQVRGVVMIDEDWKNPLVRGNLSIDPIKENAEEIGQIKVKFLIKDKIFSTETFHIQQPAGHLSLDKCQIELLPGGKFEILAELADFRLPGARLTGKIGSDGVLKTGSLGLAGKLYSNSLWINRKYKFKNLAAKYTYDSDKGLTLSPLKADTTLAGLIDASKKGRLAIKDLKILQGERELVLFKGDLDLEESLLDLEIIMSSVDLALLFQHIEVIEKVQEGLGNARFHLKGPFTSPDLSGEVVAKAKSLKVRYLPDELRGFEARMTIHNKMLSIEKLHANAGKSKLKVTSKKTESGKMDFSIQIGGQPLKINIPGFAQGGIRPNIHFGGSFDSPQCSGEIEIYNARFTYPPLRQGKEFLSNEFFDSIDWDLKLIAKKNVKYYNDFVNVEARNGSWISLKGRGENRRVGGFAWARPKRGKVSFLGTEFVVQEAELRFDEDKKPPFLFGTAKIKVEQAGTILLTHNGRLFEAEPIISAPDSYPPMTQQEIVRLLRLGIDYSDISKEDSRTLLRIGMIRLASGQFSSNLIHPLERRLSTLLNIDVDIKTPIIEKVFENSSSNNHHPLSETEINLGTYIADDFYFSYQARILDSSEKEKSLKVGHGLGLEYQFPEEEAIQYEFSPDEDPQEQEHKIMLKKELQF